MNKVFYRTLEGIEESPQNFTVKSIKKIKEELYMLLEGSFFKKNNLNSKKILLKPNLVRPFIDKLPAVCTDPRLIIALSELLIDCGARIKLGDNPGFGLSCRQAYSDSRTEPYLKKTGVEFCFFDEEEFIQKKPDNPLIFKEIYIAKEALENDIIINIPKMKTHILTMVSLGIKNLLGLIPDRQRLLFHRTDINAKITDILQVVKPSLTIVDGILAMEGQSPLHGIIRDDLPMILSGEDVVAVDAITSYLMGFEPYELTFLCLASRLGLGENDISRITIIGESIEERRRFFKRAVLSSSGRFQKINVVEMGACQGCLSALRHALDRLEFENHLQNIPMQTVYTGIPMPGHYPGISGDNVWCFGNCSHSLVFNHDSTEPIKAKFIPGCAPHIFDFYRAIKESFPVS
ncbi:MAG: DUF362 domain-containing protein [Candidatus Coatesbacteria bacterium]|nr:DUF362 domain-containing protein [Candidatus Coatesbacteria bacterium]